LYQSKVNKTWVQVYNCDFVFADALAYDEKAYFIPLYPKNRVSKDLKYKVLWKVVRLPDLRKELQNLHQATTQKQKDQILEVLQKKYNNKSLIGILDTSSSLARRNIEANKQNIEKGYIELLSYYKPDFLWGLMGVLFAILALGVAVYRVRGSNKD